MTPGQNFHLQGTSRLLGAGDVASVIATTDLDGTPRLRDGKVDIGTYEFQGTIAANQAPAVQTPTASVNPVLGKTVTLSVSASDPDGDTLTYTWSTTTGSGVTFDSRNGSASGSSVVATFSQSGSYTFHVVVDDGHGHSVRSADLTLTVTQTLRDFVVTPANRSVRKNGTLAFSAQGHDQFGLAMASVVTWSATGGTIDNAGLFTAGPTVGTYSVTAIAGSVQGSTAGSITLSDPPTIQNAAFANPNPVTGNMSSLSVLGADDGGENLLTYTWTRVSGPAAVTFTRNASHAAQASDATFTRAGSYLLRATIADADGGSVTSDVTVVVQQTVGGITVSPPSATVREGNTQNFSASLVDQFGQPMTGSVAWTVSGGGTISSAGIFSATTASATPYTVAATVGSTTGLSSVTVIANQAPTVAIAASASPNPLHDIEAQLTVQGADDEGEPALTYTWDAISKPSGATVLFSGNGSNADQNVRMTVDQVGSYTLRATITDAGGKFVTSTTVLTVVPSLRTLRLDPATVNLQSGQTQLFTAHAFDQFDQPYDTADLTGLVWSVVSGPGSVAHGLFTAGAGNATVQAALGAVVGHAAVSSQAPLAAPVLLGFDDLRDQLTLHDTLTLRLGTGGAPDGYNWEFTSSAGGSSQGVGTVGRSRSARTVTQSPALTLSSLSSTLVPGFWQVTVTATNRAGTSAAITGSFELLANDLAQARVHPNPYRSDRYTSNIITFDQLTTNSTIKLFSIDAHHVRTLDAADGSARWDMKDDGGDRVASGIYLYVITNTSGQKIRGKLGVIR